VGEQNISQGDTEECTSENGKEPKKRKKKNLLGERGQAQLKTCFKGRSFKAQYWIRLNAPRQRKTGIEKGRGEGQKEIDRLGGVRHIGGEFHGQKGKNRGDESPGGRKTQEPNRLRGGLNVTKNHNRAKK